MERFRQDNTEGYSNEELAELNRRYHAQITAAETVADDVHKSHQDYLAEQVQAEFDAERPAP